MPTLNRLSNYATTIAGDGAATRVTYHRTVIVEWTDSAITLRSGGWQTVTTKRKMNQASNQFGLGYQVYQKDHGWFVALPNGENVSFADGMTFDRV